MLSGPVTNTNFGLPHKVASARPRSRAKECCYANFLLCIKTLLCNLWTEAHVVECAILSEKRECLKPILPVCRRHQACARLPDVSKVFYTWFLKSYNCRTSFVRDLKEIIFIFVFIDRCPYFTSDEAGVSQLLLAIDVNTRRLDHL